MNEWQPLISLLVLLSAATVLGAVAELLRQHAIVGYLVAGMLVGPNVFRLVPSHESVKVIAELGVALLLFSIGLEFSLRRLIRLGPVALIGGIGQVLITFGAAAWVSSALGVDTRAALAIGAMVALSSTATVLRLLTDRAALDTQYGRNAVGVLLLQDLAVVPAMLLMSALHGDANPTAIAASLGWTVLYATGMVAAFYVLFNVITPYVLRLAPMVRNRDLPILLGVVMALGSAVVAHRIDVSPAIGAFLAGILLAASPFATQIRADVAPLRTLLVTLFFASVGMVGDPKWISDHWLYVLAVVILLVAGKALIITVIMRVLRQSWYAAFATGFCLAQVGEFSFVLAATAWSYKTVDGDTYNLVVSATIATLFITPYLVTLGPRAARWMAAKRGGKSFELHDSASEVPNDRVIIIGFGPAGQRVAEALVGDYRDRITIIDTNPSHAVVARNYNLPIQVGDATRPEVLQHAGVRRATAVIITLPVIESARQACALVRSLNPHAQLLVRSRYHMWRWELHLAGAETVVDEEEQVGLRLASEARKVLRRA
ncbi:MAG: sodium:proton exchanger [Planctomycetaceae bacterium]|nr:sodium:proton exchanger [Planctomycetaceae bacterium]